jgi:hypothetical protein
MPNKRMLITPLALICAILDPYNIICGTFIFFMSRGPTLHKQIHANFTNVPDFRAVKKYTGIRKWAI